MTTNKLTNNAITLSSFRQVFETDAKKICRLENEKQELVEELAIEKLLKRDAEKKIAEIQQAGAKAVEKERYDIATRASYLCLLACYQAGLSPKTLRRIQKLMTGCVAEKYQEYRNDQLADLWAQVTLQEIGVEVEETKEKL